LKVHFGNLTLKAYTKGEHVLRFEAIVHNTRDLGCGRVLARFAEIITRLKAMLERFLTSLNCVDAAFIADQTLEQLPLGSRSPARGSAGRPQQAPHPHRASGCGRTGPSTRRLHRRPVGRQGPAADRADRP